MNIHEDIKVGIGTPTSKMHIAVSGAGISENLFAVDAWNSTAFSITASTNNNANIYAYVGDTNFFIDVDGSGGKFKITDLAYNSKFETAKSFAGFKFTTGGNIGASLEAGILNVYSGNFGTGSGGGWFTVANRTDVGSDGTDFATIYGNLTRKINYNNTNATFYPAVFMGGNIGIDILAPTAKLHIKGDNFDNSTTTLKILDLTNTTRLELLDAGEMTLTGHYNVQGTTSIGEKLLRLYSTDWGTVGERERFYVGQGEMFVRANNYNFYASSDSGNAGLTLRGDNAGFSMYSPSFVAVTFNISNSNRPVISAPNSNQIASTSNWIFGTNSTATATVNIIGVDNTSSNYSLLVEDSTFSNLFSIRNDGYALIMNMIIGRSTNLISTNTAFGVNSLVSTITGDGNTAVGYLTLQNNTIGGNNTAIGYANMASNINGSGNTAVGNICLNNNTSGSTNVAIGQYALTANDSGSTNVAIGLRPLYSNVGGGLNTAIGSRPLFSNISGNSNIAIGGDASLFTTTGSNNIGIGDSAGVLSDGSQNIFFGTNAGRHQTAISNMLFIDNTPGGRANALTELNSSLIVGVFGATPADQSLRINAQVINLNSLPVGSAGVSSGELYADTAANILANGDLIIARKV